MPTGGAKSRSGGLRPTPPPALRNWHPARRPGQPPTRQQKTVAPKSEVVRVPLGPGKQCWPAPSGADSPEPIAGANSNLQFVCMVLPSRIALTESTVRSQFNLSNLCALSFFQEPMFRSRLERIKMELFLPESIPRSRLSGAYPPPSSPSSSLSSSTQI